MVDNLLRCIRFYVSGFLLLLASTVSVMGQSYCTPSYNFVNCNTLQRQAYIYNVQLNNRTFSTSCSQAGYAGIVNVTNAGANDPIVVTAGGGYNMTVNTYDYNSRTYSNIYNQSFYAVWIDYNNNSVFESTEQVYNGNSANFSFYPSYSVAGSYRMRIRLYVAGTTANPCTTQEYGETEDYLLKIIPPTPIVSTYAYQYPCASSGTTLSAYNCPGTIKWRDQNTTIVGDNNVVVQTSQSRSYYATCEVNGVSGSASSYVYVYPTTISPPSISSNNYNLTVGQSSALQATGCSGTVTWSTGQTGNSITVTPTTSTTYSATCYAPYYTYCTSGKSNEITINVNPPGTPSVSATKNTICPGESVVLSTSNCAGSIKWSTGSTASTLTVSPTQKTDYSASCVINGVESNKATTTVSVNPATSVSSLTNTAQVCEGSQTSFGVTASGAGTLAYSWSLNSTMLKDSSASTPQLIIKNAAVASGGNYQVRVTGTCGSVFSTSLALQVSKKMTVTPAISKVVCNGDANGAIAVSVSDGLGAKEYRLSGQETFKTSAQFDGLRSGSYTIQVRDQIGCTAEVVASIDQPASITFSVASPKSAKCAEATDGAIEVQATGGNGGFVYSLDNGTNQSSGQFGNLKANTEYIVKATDSRGCSGAKNVFVGAPNKITVSPTPVSVLCAGGTTGSVNVVATGGNGNYQYQLGQNSQQTTSTFSNLTAGSYTITVKDNVGCEGKADVVVTQPSAVSVTATTTMVSCINDSSATIRAVGSGGVGLFQYQIVSRAFQSTDLFDRIREGSYTVTAKDGNGCLTNTTVQVKKAEPLLVQATSKAASCCSCADGSITLLSSGGIGLKQYRFAQASAQAGNSFTTIIPGQYTVSAQDETGCTTSATVVVTNATAMTLTLANVKNVSCAGGRDGSATIQVAGGNGNLKYTWQAKNPVDSTNKASVNTLPEGAFTVTVTDSKLCSSTTSATLTALNPLPPKPIVTLNDGTITANATAGVQWYTGNDLATAKPVLNANQSTLNPFQSSSYFAIVTLNGCASPPSDLVNFLLLSTEPTSILSIKVYPNPIREQLRVETTLKQASTVNIQLFDLKGNSVFKVSAIASLGKQNFAWPLPGLKTGIYIMKSETKEQQAIQRVLIE